MLVPPAPLRRFEGAGRSLIELAVACPGTSNHFSQHSHIREKQVCPVANIKSQIKRNRQAEVRRQRNKAERSTLKTKVKNFISAAEGGDDKAQEMYADVSKSIDQAAAKGLIHKNKAAHQKSRLAKRLAKS